MTVKNGTARFRSFVLKRLFTKLDAFVANTNNYNSAAMITDKEWDKLREMIARCTWTFAKTMPWCPHEYIVRGKCPLSEEEFVYFIEIQRNYGKVERWGKYITPYLYIDGYKYWTMGAPVEETIVMNRAKVTIERRSESDEECR